MGLSIEDGVGRYNINHNFNCIDPFVKSVTVGEYNIEIYGVHVKKKLLFNNIYLFSVFIVIPVS